MANSKLKVLNAASRSQSNYKKTVAENKQEFYQDVVDDRFTYATDYMVIKEETECGNGVFANIGARVTHAVNTSASDTFAKEFKKIIFQNYDHEQYLGKKYKFNRATWLTTDLDEVTNVSSHSFVRKCNNTLKWYDSNGILNEEPCVFTKQFSNTKFDEGSKGVMQVSGDFMVLCQANAKTKAIPYNQRFVFNGLTFQITQYDNHRSDTYLIFKLQQIDVQANDNVVDNVANDNQSIVSEGGETKILPQIIKILEGESQTFTVYNYQDGEATADGFTITASQALSICYELSNVTANSFKIKNLAESQIPLLITCTNTRTLAVTRMNIILGGIY